MLLLAGAWLVLDNRNGAADTMLEHQSGGFKLVGLCERIRIERKSYGTDVSKRYGPGEAYYCILRGWSAFFPGGRCVAETGVQECGSPGDGVRRVEKSRWRLGGSACSRRAAQGIKKDNYTYCT